jgi:hypothetical protein
VVKQFNIDTIEERLKIYRYLLYRYTTKIKMGSTIYKYDTINPFGLGICFYLKRQTNVNFEDLEEMKEVFNTKNTQNGLLGTVGDLRIRKQFILEVINVTLLKIKNNNNQLKTRKDETN